MVNHAVAINGNIEGATQDLTTHGSDFLWACFAVMLLADIIVFAWHLTIPRGQRVFHQLGLLILTTASIAYFTLASDLGKAPVGVEFRHSDANNFPKGTSRSIWYVRYIDWVITTPCLLLELVLATGLPLSDIISLVFFDLVMIITGLVGALIPTTYKWGFFTFGCVAEFYIWWVLAGPARKSAGLLGGGFKRSFTISAITLSSLWLLYPIAWGLADGGNVITTDSEMVFYGVLDVLAKPVFLFLHLFLLRKENLSLLQLSSGKFSATGGVAAYDAEKQRPTVGTGNTAMATNAGAVPATEAKKGFFSRRGQYDATANPVTEHTHTAEPALGRPSEATVISQ